MKDFMKKYWGYVLGVLLFLVPLMFGIFGGDFFIKVFDNIFGFILDLYYNNILISSLASYTIMLIMMVALYYINKRNVGLIRYILAFTVINIFMILVYDLAFIMVIALSRFTIYFDVFNFCRRISFFTAPNFGNFYTFEVGIAFLSILGFKFFKKMNSVEKEVNIQLLEKMDEGKIKRNGLPYFGKLDEYYNDLVSGMNDTLSKKIDHPTLEEMDVYFPEIRVSLDKKLDYLKNVDKNLEKAISEKLKENGIDELSTYNSIYDNYTSTDGEVKDLILKDKLCSDLKYTLYKNMRSNMQSIMLNHDLYLDGLSEEKNEATLNNRLDEVILQKSILKHFDIEVDRKYEEAKEYFKIIINHINNLFTKLNNDKSTFLKNNSVSKNYSEFDKDSVIVRNVNIIDELVIDSRTMIFSPKGIYSVENLDFDNVKSLDISAEGKWTITDYSGNVQELRDATVKTKNHIAMERKHLNQELIRNNITLSKEITIEPLYIINNENITINNNTDIAIMHEHEYVPYIESKKDFIDSKDLTIVKNAFIGEKEIEHEYNQVDYVKYFEYIIDVYFRYADELKEISSRLDYIIKVLTDEQVISDNYLSSTKEYTTKYYSYDYLLYLSHQNHYLGESEFKSKKMD